VHHVHEEIMEAAKWQSCQSIIFDNFVPGVRVSGNLLDKLMSKGGLDFQERAMVDNVQPATEEQKARCLVDLLMKKEQTFDIFCSALDDAGYKRLASNLRKTASKLGTTM
jgi:hypothetical protein